MAPKAERYDRPKTKEILDRSSAVITIDGSTTAGKRLVAERLAERYDLSILNTGVTIRSLALLAIEQHMVETDETNVTSIPVDFNERILDFFDANAEKFRIEPPMEGSRNARHMFGSREMRGELLAYPKEKAIDNLSSVIAASPMVRAKLYDCWRGAVPCLGGTVVVGRKTGVDLFPNADIKIYLYASPEASAAYRVLHDPWARMKQESEERYIRERDWRDEESGLLDRPSDALIVDTSAYIKNRFGIPALEARITKHIEDSFIIQ